jgi:hypothetical protein
MFHVGQMVVCIKDGWSRGDPIEESLFFPVKGRIYTIRTIEKSLCKCGLSLRFEEIVNPPLLFLEGIVECDFAADRFRPVRKTDISALRDLVAPRPKVDA